MTLHYSNQHVTVHHGDCLDVLAAMPEASVDAVVTDPPYGLEFMGKEWDRFDAKPRRIAGTGGSESPFANHAVPLTPERGRAFQQWCELWASECLRVLKPGGHMLAFGGTRTWHRLACAIEDAGFEIRDSIAWLYGSGFPKSLDVSKAIDKAAGAEREVVGITKGKGGENLNALAREGGNDSDDAKGCGAYGQGAKQVDIDIPITAPTTDAAKQWQGWGTSLKPAFEPIVVARKPLVGTVAANVQAHGTGALNIDACRVDLKGESWGGNQDNAHTDYSGKILGKFAEQYAKPSNPAGHWPANVVLDTDMAAELDKQSGNVKAAHSITADNRQQGSTTVPFGVGRRNPENSYGDSGGGSRFFPVFKYEPKAPGTERPTADGIAHPTVKPLDLMRWLIRLVTPPGGVVLDPFAGSGTTGEAAMHEHKRAILIEREADYMPLIVARLHKPMEIGFDFGEETA